MNLEKLSPENFHKESDNSDNGKSESPETTIEQQVALQKLEMLENPNFREFGIRFMTREEYEAMMQSQQDLAGREVYVFSEDTKNSIPFSDYLRTNSGDWRKAIYRQTEWSHSNADLNMADTFLKFLKEAHNELRQYKNESGKEKVREETLKLFREKLIEYLSKQYYSNNPYQIKSKATEAFGTAKSLEYRESTAGYHDKLRHSKDPYEELEDLVRKGVASKRVSGDRETIFGGLDFDIRFPSDLKSEERNLWIKAQSERAYQEISRSFSRMQEEEQKIYGDQYEKIETLKKFISDSNWISENKENLRSLFEILLYIKPKKIKQEEAQYHVGVVVELPAIMRGQGLDLLRKEWGRVKSGEKGKEQDNETRRILSTIILMPDKKLVAIAKDLSSRAGLLSNPIFERNGHVVYPEKEKATA